MKKLILYFILSFFFSFLTILFTACEGNESQQTNEVKIKFICTWGDSLTAGSGGSGTTFPTVLQSLLGESYKVINCGIGGENSLTIAGRQGGIPMAIKHSVELPADNSEIIIGDKGFRKTKSRIVITIFKRRGASVNIPKRFLRIS